MPPTVYSCLDAQMRESGGEDFTTLVNSATLTVEYTPGQPPVIDVGGTKVDWQGGFRKIDRRDYMFPTSDLLAFQYVTLPTGLEDSEYEQFEVVLTAIREGVAIPKPGTSVAALMDKVHGGKVDTSFAGQMNAIGGVLGCLAQKAMHDTGMLGNAIRERAEHDIKLLQQQNKEQEEAQGVRPLTG